MQDDNHALPDMSQYRSAGAIPHEIVRRCEVFWYRNHGKYPKQRIRRGLHNAPYVVADFLWNKENPYRKEFVDFELANFVKDQMTFEPLTPDT